MAHSRVRSRGGHLVAVGVKIEGLEEVIEQLTGVLPREAKNLARSAVHSIASQMRDEIRREAPVDTGTLRKSIFSYRRRGTATQVVSEVRARKSGFYWRFIEFGTVNQPARPFVNPTVERMRGLIVGIFRNQLGKRLEKLMAKKAKR